MARGGKHGVSASGCESWQGWMHLLLVLYVGSGRQQMHPALPSTHDSAARCWCARRQRRGPCTALLRPCRPSPRCRSHIARAAQCRPCGGSSGAQGGAWLRQCRSRGGGLERMVFLPAPGFAKSVGRRWTVRAMHPSRRQPRPTPPPPSDAAFGCADADAGRTQRSLCAVPAAAAARQAVAAPVRAGPLTWRFSRLRTHPHPPARSEARRCWAGGGAGVVVKRLGGACCWVAGLEPSPSFVGHSGCQADV